MWLTGSSLEFFFFFFNDTATTEIYTLSLHDALPIYQPLPRDRVRAGDRRAGPGSCRTPPRRSEEHTSELQSRSDLVCRLLLEKKKKKKTNLLPDKHQPSIRAAAAETSVLSITAYRDL